MLQVNAPVVAKLTPTVPPAPEASVVRLAGLRSAHGVLQGAIAGQLHLKRTPTLEFVYDSTTDRALRVETLLRERA